MEQLGGFKNLPADFTTFDAAVERMTPDQSGELVRNVRAACSSAKQA
jgi:hypothetical protein